MPKLLSIRKVNMKGISFSIILQKAEVIRVKKIRTVNYIESLIKRKEIFKKHGENKSLFIFFVFLCFFDFFYMLFQT